MRRNARRAVLAVLFAAALWTSLPQLARMTRDAALLARLPYEQRRAHVLGPFYPAIRRIGAQLPPGEPVGISLRVGERDMAAGVFANYYLYPQPTRFYVSLDDYRVLVLADPTHPKKLVRIDPEYSPVPRLMSYAEVRHEEVVAKPVVRDPKPGTKAVTEAIVPMALAIDGQPGNSYTTDGVLVSDVDASVTLTLFPTGETKTFALRAREPLVVRDAVYVIAARMEAGWLQLRATAPVRAAFWYVSRGRSHAVLLPLVEQLPPFPQQVAGGEKFWVLNPGAEAAEVVVNGETHVVEARALAALPPQPRNAITANRPVLAFSVSKPDGLERFHWPEGMP